MSTPIDVQRHDQGRAAFGQSADIGNKLQWSAHQSLGSRALRCDWLLLFCGGWRRILAAKPLRETFLGLTVHLSSYLASRRAPIARSVSITVAHIRSATGRLSR